MQFVRLVLSGFKSFADPTTVEIAPGMTGVVGPNGCGKSNLTEALRWVMGEASARTLRGTEMDDVIFAGAEGRGRRNLAEVTLVLDNGDGRAPPPWTEAETIEVRRRIERGQGTQYRVNGRPARARDVQILFADAASGARSTAIVGQGQIGQIISARASDRRAILEEAAGIGGLHARRREAEQRLSAAEANLTRLDDIIATLAERVTALRQQAREARRYGRLSQRLRLAQAELMLARRIALVERRARAAEREAMAETGLAQATATAGR
ncbi:AAA family ATPase, partial [Tistrella mobilis]